MPISQDVLDLYDRLIATQPHVQRKGATMPYTSLNGHMFSFLTPDGRLALRLPSSERDAFWPNPTLACVSSTGRFSRSMSRFQIACCATSAN